MTAAVLLTAYAVAVGCLAPTALRGGWASRVPRLAMALWLTLSVSWVAAVALAILGVAAPFWLSWPSHQALGPVLQPGHWPPGNGAQAIAGLLLAVTVVLRAGASVARGLARARRERREHAAFLAAVGQPDPVLGAVILPHDVPAAYCLPYGRHRIAVSTGAIAALRASQVEAVLAHERAHLRGRHHVIVTTAAALARAFPRVPLLAQASTQAPILAEMAADDAAARRHEPGDLAAAMVIFARTGARAGALTVGGPAAAVRVQRLLAPPPRAGVPARTVLRLATAAAVLMFSAGVACLPLIVVTCGLAGQP